MTVTIACAICCLDCYVKEFGVGLRVFSTVSAYAY